MHAGEPSLCCFHMTFCVYGCSVIRGAASLGLKEVEQNTSHDDSVSVTLQSGLATASGLSGPTSRLAKLVLFDKTPCNSRCVACKPRGMSMPAKPFGSKRCTRVVRPSKAHRDSRHAEIN